MWYKSPPQRAEKVHMHEWYTVDDGSILCLFRLLTVTTDDCKWTTCVTNEDVCL